MIIIKNTNINLKDTVTCGQIFRYYEEEDLSYTIILSDRVINVKKIDNDLIVKSNNEENLENIIKKYFDLERDYEKLNKEILKKDKNLKDIIDKCYGFKIISQSSFECILSYIISANNGVPQIKNAVNNISEKYGKKVVFNEKEYYLFPSPIDLKDVMPGDYRKLKVGFRDKYIYEIVRKINSKEFDLTLPSKMNTEEAMNYFMSNKGIGEKVASCILLFAYRKFEVFPIDTWVKKFMKDYYSVEGIKNIRKFISEKFGKQSGIVIQYMFHYKRNKNS